MAGGASRASPTLNGCCGAATAARQTNAKLTRREALMAPPVLYDTPRISMIRRCGEGDFEEIWEIINDGARAYKGVIPADRWHEPYMSRDHLRGEIEDGIEFWGFEDSGALDGVMGIQPVQDVTLIR